jgi:hypothetical protein
MICTKDDNVVLKAELKDSGIFLTIIDLRSKRLLKTASCKPNSGSQFSDNKMHKVTLSKENRNQVNNYHKYFLNIVIVIKQNNFFLFRLLLSVMTASLNHYNMMQIYRL